MTAFDRLGGTVRHHVVNSLGWRTLRPLQEHAIEPLLDGHSALLLAPTAGGKTEAAAFPLLTRMADEDWRPVSVLYVCPIKALLNNLEHRLRAYTGWIGRTVGLWHGDVTSSARTRLLQEPPDILLITPESLEVMLTSSRIDAGALFANVAALVVDEIHAFAGDDRGWHLLAVVDRIARLSGRPVQRIGLSATVGNPDALLEWLAGGTGRESVVVSPPPEAGTVPDIRIDRVGTLANAALVISRLHRGEKRLVFCDSRARSEELASELRARDVETFVSHSSLSVDERRRAEAAFAEARDCVIVATSTLELGIDVGDLDRVIQIDAPAKVASFLQRLGRTGRRPGTVRNCLFLATGRDAFVQAVGLARLWRDGFVEPIEPPAKPFPVLAQQVMALCLQRRDLGRHTWEENLPTFLPSAGLTGDDARRLIEFMLYAGFLVDTGGLIGLGPAAEKAFGAKHYLALFSVFDSPPLFTVMHGRTELGSVHETSFRMKPKDGPTVLSLAGRSWAVRFVDWQRQTAWVDPSDRIGRSRWLGGGPTLGFELCQAIKRVLAGEVPEDLLSRRALEAMEEVRDEHDWVDVGATTLLLREEGASWYTFGGGLLNAALATRLSSSLGDWRPDSFGVHAGIAPDPGRLREAIAEVVEGNPSLVVPPVDEEAVANVKFAECVAPELLSTMWLARYVCRAAWDAVRGLALVVARVDSG